MPRLLAIVLLGVLLVAGEARAQDLPLPPPVPVLPDPDPPNPFPDPGAPSASLRNAADTWSLYGLAYALGGLLAGFVTGVTGTLGACHLKRTADGGYSLTRGTLDVDAVRAQLDRIESRLEAIPPATLSPPRDLPMDPKPRERKRPTLAPPPPAGPEDPP